MASAQLRAYVARPDFAGMAKYDSLEFMCRKFGLYTLASAPKKPIPGPIAL